MSPHGGLSTPRWSHWSNSSRSLYSLSRSPELVTRVDHHRPQSPRVTWSHERHWSRRRASQECQCHQRIRSGKYTPVSMYCKAPVRPRFCNSGLLSRYPPESRWSHWSHWSNQSNPTAIAHWCPQSHRSRLLESWCSHPSHQSPQSPDIPASQESQGSHGSHASPESPDSPESSSDVAS